MPFICLRGDFCEEIYSQCQDFVKEPFMVSLHVVGTAIYIFSLICEYTIGWLLEANQMLQQEREINRCF